MTSVSDMAARDALMRLEGERAMLAKLVPLVNKISAGFAEWRSDRGPVAAAVDLFEIHAEVIKLLHEEAVRLQVRVTMRATAGTA